MLIKAADGVVKGAALYTGLFIGVVCPPAIEIITVLITHAHTQNYIFLCHTRYFTFLDITF